MDQGAREKRTRRLLERLEDDHSGALKELTFAPQEKKAVFQAQADGEGGYPLHVPLWRVLFGIGIH